ncbi:MAG TPA: hypothetical protein VFJ91_12990 [Gaiellaceae bacterium]|nr:hypothetical protein [Gaiellaceae bacterium]
MLVPTAAAALVAATAAFGAPPGASYPWAQPGTALPTATCTQPPASVPIAPAPAAAPGCSYEWAQPGTLALQTVSTQPPAWVPIVPAKAGP